MHHLRVFFVLSILYTPILICLDDRFNSLISVNKDFTVGETNWVAIKDNIDVEGFATTAGSLALKNNFPKKDAYLVAKLKANDFRVLGKTNLSEWANFRSTNSVSGWSSVGKQTFNPFGKNLSPCGSSSGSAVIVAAGITDYAIGTETNGSISCPASVNGIVGFKPTVGLVSRAGIIPISHTQDTAGPMTRTVYQAATLLESIAGKDPNDISTNNIPQNFNFNFTKDLNADSLVGRRFGLLVSGIEYEPASSLIELAKKIITRNGGEVVMIEDKRVYPQTEEYLILLYEFKIGLERYLKKARVPYKTLDELIEFNINNKEAVMPYFEQEIFIQSQESSSKHSEYKNAILVVDQARREIDELLNKYNLDALVGLTRNPAWQIDYINGDSGAFESSISFGNGAFAAIAGYPHLTVPIGRINQSPVGFSFIGTAWSDKKLLEYGYSFEQAKIDLIK